MIGVLHTIGNVAATVILGAYLVVLVIQVIVALLWILVPSLKPRAKASQLNDVIMTALARHDPFARFAGVMTAIGALVAWPIVVNVGFLMVNRKTDTELAARLALRPADLRVAVYNLCLLILILGLAWLRLGPDPLLLVYVELIVIATVARHLSYLVGPLLSRLRRSRIDPRTYFFAIAASDIATFVLGISALFESGQRLHPTIHDVGHAALDLLTFNNIVDLANQSIGHAPIIVISLLVYAVILKSLATYSEFTRTDDDILNVASAFAVLGDFRRARGWLAKERGRTNSSFLWRSIIEVGMRDFAKGLDFGRQYRRAIGEDDDLNATLVQTWGATLVVALDATVRLQFMEQEIQWHAADITIALQIDQTLGLSLIPAEDLVSKVLPKLDKDHYPIARAILLIHGDEFDESQKLLDSARPGSEIEEVLRILLLGELEAVRLVAGDSKPDQVKQFLEEWHKRQFPTVKELSLPLRAPWRSSALYSVAGFNAMVGRFVDYDYEGMPRVSAELAGDLLQLMNELAEGEGELQQVLSIRSKLAG